jgi:hypothetical protein
MDSTYLRAEWTSPADNAHISGVALFDAKGEQVRFVAGPDVQELIDELNANPANAAIAREIEGRAPSHI